MLARVVEAAIGVGLLSRAEGGMISLCQGLDPAECDLKSLSAVLPLTLARLVFSSTNDANHDLAVWIAWLLAHDLDEAPANWAAIQASLETHPPPDVAKLNDARFTQLEDWACYLGFAWRHAPEGKTALVPDPTAFIRRVLPNLLPIGSQISLATFFRDLADRAPVLDGGRFRVAVEGAWGERADHYISATTALAVLRLRDEGILALESQSDAEVFAFQDRDQVERFTHVSRKGPRGPKGTS